MSKHPFIREETVDRSAYGRAPRIDRYFEMRDFAWALALELEVNLINEEESRSVYGCAYLDCGDDLSIRIYAQTGAKIGRVEISASASEITRKLDSHDWVNMPSATYDAARPIDAIAKAVRKNIIEPARPIVAGLRERARARDDAAAEFGRQIKQMEADFPGLSVTRQNERDLSANLYLNNGKGYVYGSVMHGHGFNLQRVSISAADDVRAFLSLMTAGE